MWNKMEPVHGKVEFHGFSHVMEEQLETAFNIDKIQEAFELFDSERKQYFDANDLDRVMRSLNEHLTMDQIKDMVRFCFLSLSFLSFYARACADHGGRLPGRLPHQPRRVPRYDGVVAPRGPVLCTSSRL